MIIVTQYKTLYIICTMSTNIDIQSLLNTNSRKLSSVTLMLTININ